MKATLVKNLFRRPQPTNEVNAHGALDKGTVIDIVETVQGKMIDGEDKWHKASDGFFYWGGGVLVDGAAMISSISAHEPQIKFDSAKMSWAHKFLEIPFIWNDINSFGKNVVIGIIDSGIETSHNDLMDAIIVNSVNINDAGDIDNTTEISERLKDNRGHGTEMSGIISASGKGLVFGIAPKSKLLIAKVTNEGFGIKVKPVARALRFMKENKVDLISISLTAPNDPDLETAVRECLDNNIPIFAAIGDNHIESVNGNNKLDRNTFPACYKGCIAIGSFDQAGRLCSFSNRNDNLSFLAPGDRDNILTTTLNNSASFCSGETSIATAISAGCFALVVSYLKEKNRIELKQKALEILLASCDDMGPIIGKDPAHGFGRINLRNTISRLKNLL